MGFERVAPIDERRLDTQRGVRVCREEFVGRTLSHVRANRFDQKGP